MLFQKKFVSLTPSVVLEDPSADYKTAKRLGQYRLSSLALYQPSGNYLPIAAITHAEIGTGATHVTGCCAGGVPVPRVLVNTADRKFQFLCDTPKMAQTMLEAFVK